MTTWNENLIQRLIRLWRDGRTAGTIAQLLGMSRNAVTSKARRLDLERRESPIMSQLDRYAEALAETDHIVKAGQRIGVKETRARELFKQLQDDLGWQAV